MLRLLKAEGIRLVEGHPAATPPTGAPGERPAGGPDGGPPGGHGVRGGSGRLPARLRLRSPRQLLSARARARRLLESASQQARALQEASRREGFQLGWQEGLAQGLRQGREEAQAQARQLLAQLEQLVAQAASLREQALQEAEADIVALALAVAEKLVRHEIARGPEVTLEVVRSLLASRALGGEPAWVRVYVHPDEWEWLCQLQPGQLAGQARLRLEWVADPSVEPGGCRLETDLGTVDATLPTRLEALRQALEVELHHGAAR